MTPDRLIGRVSSVARGIALGAQPLGPLVAGLLLAATTPRWTIFVFAARYAPRGLDDAQPVDPPRAEPPELAPA